MPQMSRPPEMMSMLAAILASTAGCRYVFPETIVPTRIRFVSAASAVSVVQASSMSPTRSGVFGMKWSVTQAASQPVSSAWRHSAETSFHVVLPMLEKMAKRMRAPLRKGFLPDPSHLLLAEGVELLSQVGTRVGQDGHGEERRVDRARLADGERAHGNAGGHLHHGQERVHALEGRAFHGHAQHGQNGVGRHDASQVRGSAGRGDDD